MSRAITAQELKATLVRQPPGGARCATQERQQPIFYPARTFA